MFLSAVMAFFEQPATGHRLDGWDAVLSRRVDNMEQAFERNGNREFLACNMCTRMPNELPIGLTLKRCQKCLDEVNRDIWYCSRSVSSVSTCL